MSEFIFYKIEDISYRRRSSGSQKLNLFISVAFFILIYLILNWQYGLIIAILFFLIQYLKSNRWDKYFISYMELKNGIVTIKYKEKNQEKILSGSKYEFVFKKEIAINRTKTTYMAVYQNNSLQIKQFEIGDWKEKDFDTIILAFT